MAENRVLRERLGNKKLRLSESFRCRVQEIGIDEVLTAPRSPWQNSYAERIVGSIRRGCLDHVIVLGERHLRRILTAYLAYYNESRTHLSLGKDAPETRAVQPPTKGDLLVAGYDDAFVKAVIDTTTATSSSATAWGIPARRSTIPRCSATW